MRQQNVNAFRKIQIVLMVDVVAGECSFGLVIDCVQNRSIVDFAEHSVKSGDCFVFVVWLSVVPFVRTIDCVQKMPFDFPVIAFANMSNKI